MLTPIGVVALALVLALVVVTAPRWWALLRRADLPGALLLGLALGSVVLTFAASDPEREVVGPLGFALLPVGAVALGLYLWRHRTAAEPLVARGVVRGRARTSLVVSLMVGAALVAVIVDVPVLARLTLTDSQTVAAFVLVRFLLAVPVGALLGGWSLRRFGDGLVSGVGLLLATVGLFVMSGWGDGSLDGPMATVVLVVVGLGIGLALAPVNNAALADAPADAHGVASALVVVARMVGMVVGLALLTAIGLHRYYDTVAGLPDQTDTKALLAAGLVQVQTVFLGAAIAALLGALASIGLGLRAVDRRTITVRPDRPVAETTRPRLSPSPDRRAAGPRQEPVGLDRAPTDLPRSGSRASRVQHGVERVDDLVGGFVHQHVTAAGQHPQLCVRDQLAEPSSVPGRRELVLVPDQDHGRYAGQLGECLASRRARRRRRRTGPASAAACSPPCRG